MNHQLDPVIFEYGSPTKEKSLFKWIPVENLDDTKEKLAKLWPNLKFRIVYRGPRFDKYRLSTRKFNATHFSVYSKPVK